MKHSDLASILSPGVALREVEGHILSVYGAGERPGAYDHHGSATFYDKVMCNGFYNRVMWGYDVKEYQVFIRPALESSAGWALDVACGSLAFTADLYAGFSGRPVILLDQSLDLLKKAKARLVERLGEVPPNMILLQADALALPFRPETVTTVISLNILHCLEDLQGVIREWRRVATPDGSVRATTLIRNRWFGDRYLNTISRSEMMFSRTPEEVGEVFRGEGLPADLRLAGNLAFYSHGGSGGEG